MGPGTLESILKDFDFPKDENLLVGTDTRDDAGVYRLDPETALIQTLDFFTPMVDDPFVFGQIAAANAINDVYAMGGTPLLVMNIVCYPQCEDLTVLRDILSGGLDKIKEAGALLLGGHTVDDQEPKYGLAVTGLVHPQKITSNCGAEPGDIIFLTKPLGNGVISTAIKADMASPEAYREATMWMSTLNRKAAGIMQEVGAHAATDVTGFGFLGHLFELASASDVTVEVDASKIRFMTGTMEYANLGLIPGGAYTNREYLLDKVTFADGVDSMLRDLLFSPETAGGLLMVIDKDKAAQLQRLMQDRQVPCFQVGTVLDHGFDKIIVQR